MERQDPADARARSLHPLASMLLILGAGAAINLPWIRAPFGPNEINSTSYFGPFAQSFARFGFGALRGIPVAGYGLGNLAEGVPYLNHPPAVAWLSGLGCAEWQVRLPFAIAQALAGCALFANLRRRAAAWRATLAGCILVCLPVFAFYGRTIFDAFTVLFGLLAFLFFDLAAQSEGPRRQLWTALLALSAFLGIWTDWPFGFWLGGLAAFVPAADFRRRASLFAVACLAAALGVAAVLGWQKWALGNPDLPFALPPPQESIASRVLEARPPLADYLRGVGRRFVEGFSLAALAAAGLGLLPLAARAPRVVAALVLAGLGHVTIFAVHAQTHPTFSSDFGPLVAAAACSFPRLPGRVGRAVAVLVALAALAGAAASSVARLREADTTFLRDVGGVLDRLSADVRPNGSIERVYRVRHNLPHDFPYYIRSPFTRPRVLTLAEVRRELDQPSPHGLRYLWFGVATTREPLASAFHIEPALAAWLAGFPSRPLPELVRTIEIPGDDTQVRILECRVYELK
jgi:4-amino-4-deoxy-L-arabinose transferase-like glycosyltransferase